MFLPRNALDNVRSPRRVRPPARRRPALESLEGRLVLSTAAPHVAAAPAAHVAPLAATTPSLDLGRFAVKNGHLVLNGTSNGQAVTVPVAARITPASQNHGSPSVTLTVGPADLDLSGINVQIRPINLKFTAQAGSPLGGTLAELLNAQNPRSPNLNALSSGLNSVLDRFSGGVLTLENFAYVRHGIMANGTFLGQPFQTRVRAKLLPSPTPGASPTINLNIFPVSVTQSGLQVRTLLIQARITAVPGTSNALGQVINGLTANDARIPFTWVLTGLLNLGFAGATSSGPHA